MVRPSRRGRTLPLAESQWTDGVDAGGEDGIDWDTGGLDDVVAQDQWKQPVVAATTGDVTIATALNAGDTVDGVTLAAGDRVLVRAQSNDEENGIYLAGTTPERAADMDEADEVLGALVYVIDGTANGGTVYRCDLTAAPIIDTDPITFAELSGGGSGSLTVEESDASPSVSPVDTIIVDAADFTLVDNMDGSVTLTTDEPDAVAHIADTTDAHDASAISIADAGGFFTGTDVEAALQELGAGGGGGGGGSSFAEYYGDGSDGDVTISVDTTLARPMFYNNLTVNSGIVLNPSVYPIHVKNTLDNNGTIRRNGGTATNQNGAIAGASGWLGNGTSGGNGRANSAGGGNTGTNDTANAWGGNGGAGGSATNAGGNGGAAAISAVRWGMRVMPDAITGYTYSSGAIARYVGGAGGGGGGTAVSTINTVSGGGGSGGPIIVIAAKTIDNGSGVIEANGGGGAAALVTSVGAAGGGGGGGGGVVVLIYDTLTAGTEQAAGGTGGAGVNGGNAGTNGSAGKVVKMTPSGTTTT